MKLADLPTKIDIAFASNAAPGFVRPILDTTAIPGAASWSAGFPPLNMEPIASGGIPPFGQDMNGALLAISAWTRYNSSAGGQVTYDSVFSSEVGGYPKGAFILASNNLGFWLSTKDDNTTNPDTTFNGDWVFVETDVSTAGDPNGSQAGVVGTASNAPTKVWDRTNNILWYCITGGIAGVAVFVPLVVVTPVNPSVSGATYNYTIADNGQLRVRNNAGAAMTDQLPAISSVTNGWTTSIRNDDSAGILTIHVPSGAKLNNVVDGTITLAPTQATTVVADAVGNFWLLVPPVPVAFSGQAIYVNISGTYAPGVYDVDTSLGAIIFTLEAGGVVGDNYRINDIAGYFGTNNCILAGNGRTIEGETAFPLDVNWMYGIFSLLSGEWKAR